jgi:predicted nucleic acid-binding protein
VKILLDTSVIISGIVESHPMHAKCLPWLQRAKAGEVECIVVSHTLAETYAVLTTLPVKPRISPLVAHRLIDNNLQAVARIVPLTTAGYWNTIQRMTETGLSGGRGL